MDDLFDCQLECPIDFVYNKIDLYYGKLWYEQVASKPKLRLYIEMKTKPSVELYVSSFIGSKFRSYMAQTRFGILPLAIEIGRFRGVPLNDRLCLCCTMNVVENETHFLFECSLYDTLRVQWISNMNVEQNELLNMTEKEKLTFVFNKPKYTGRFVALAMDKRRHHIYDM